MFAVCASSFSLLLMLLLAVSSNAVDKIRSPKSLDDVLDHQQNHLNITNDYAIITMDVDGDSKNYSASFILPANQPLEFAFKVHWQGTATVTGNMQLQLNAGNESNTIFFSFGILGNDIIFQSNDTTVGSTSKSNPVISFKFSPFGELSNNGSRPLLLYYSFPGIFNINKEERQLNFVLSWETPILLECYIPIEQFGVEAPPPTTTTQTTTTTIETTSTESEKLEEISSTSSTPPSATSTEHAVADAASSIGWIVGGAVVGSLVIILIIAAVAFFFWKKHKKATKAKSRKSPMEPPPTQSTNPTAVPRLSSTPTATLPSEGARPSPLKPTAVPCQPSTLPTETCHSTISILQSDATQPSSVAAAAKEYPHLKKCRPRRPKEDENGYVEMVSETLDATQSPSN